jgi:CheY-like chemotaxis protein
MSSARTVLLVDDDADFVEMNRMLLEQNGYAVRVAYSGRQCLAEVAAHRPDLIILDMVMESRDDGFEVSRQLRNSEHTKAIPVVMITSANDSIPFHLEPDRTWLPVDTLLEKPVEPQLLLTVVDKALRPKEAPAGRAGEAPARRANDARPGNDAQARPG